MRTLKADTEFRHRTRKWAATNTWLQREGWPECSPAAWLSASRTHASPDEPAPCVTRGRVRRSADGDLNLLLAGRTHLRLLPPSWLHSSKVKPSKPSVCMATLRTHTHTHVSHLHDFPAVEIMVDTRSLNNNASVVLLTPVALMGIAFLAF